MEKSLAIKNDYQKALKMLKPCFKEGRVWKLTLWNNDTLYLTEKEKKAYFGAINSGAVAFEINGCCISKSFVSIKPVEKSIKDYL